MARKLRFFKDQVRSRAQLLSKSSSQLSLPQCTEAGVAVAPRPSMFRKELEVDELEVRG